MRIFRQSIVVKQFEIVDFPGSITISICIFASIDILINISY